MCNNQSILVLTKEPFVGYMPTDVTSMLYQGIPEDTLSLLFVHVANKAGSLFCNLDSGDEWAKYAFHIWNKIEEQIMDKIFDILLKEDSIAEIPATGKYNALMPFMDRNGYCCSNGWWVPIE